MHTTIAALLANKANTRLALATALAERNAECVALRATKLDPKRIHIATDSRPENDRAAPANTNRKVVAPRAPWARPAWMEAARQHAMANNCVVLA